jgi:hypothetical protein
MPLGGKSLDPDRFCLSRSADLFVGLILLVVLMMDKPKHGRS